MRLHVLTWKACGAVVVAILQYILQLGVANPAAFSCLCLTRRSPVRHDWNWTQHLSQMI